MTKRKLNPRYYASANSAFINFNFKYDVEYSKKASELSLANILKWVKDVEQASRSLGHLRCRGVVNATVVSFMIGYATEGSFLVFDEQTESNMLPALAELFSALNSNPAEVEPYKVKFTITVNMKKVCFQDGSEEVSFEELDTERRRKPRKTKVVTVPSVMSN